MNGISQLLRGMVVLLIDAAQFGMSPASPYRSIIFRNRMERGKW